MRINLLAILINPNSAVYTEREACGHIRRTL
jgi:hypothetical protein